jgi:uncharacterized protein
MKKLFSLITGGLLLSTICAAQSVASTDVYQDSGQSVADAARANQPAKVDPAKEANIRHLLELTGAVSVATQSMDDTEKSIRPLLTGSLPPGDYREKLVDLFFAKFHSERDPAQLVALLIPIYERHYSADEIKGLIAFYESPLGQKMTSSLPEIASECRRAGAKWGQEMGRNAMAEVLQEHPELRKQLEEAKANLGPR